MTHGLSGLNGLAKLRGRGVGVPGGKHGPTKLSYRRMKDGDIEARLSVTLPDGSQMVFRHRGHIHFLRRQARARAAQVGGFPGSFLKGIGKIAKKVATSGVFKAAGTALAVIAPALGPLAPIAGGLAIGMKVSTALLASKKHRAAGNEPAAKKLVEHAAALARTAGPMAPKVLQAGIRTARAAITAQAAPGLRVSQAGHSAVRLPGTKSFGAVKLPGQTFALLLQPVASA